MTDAGFILAGDFLLNRPLFLGPLRLGVIHSMQTGSLGLQRNIKVGRGYGCEILRDVLLRIGVIFTAQKRVDCRCLIGSHSLASAKRHVLLRMSHTGKARRRLIAASEYVQLNRHDGRERTSNNDHSQTVRQCSACDRSRIGRLGRGGIQGASRAHERQQ